jgi:hypothetical protein
MNLDEATAFVTGGASALACDALLFGSGDAGVDRGRGFVSIGSAWVAALQVGGYGG